MKIEKKIERLTMAFGQLLLKYRTENNLTRTALAERLSVSDSRIKQWENGGGASATFSLESLITFAAELQLSPSDLLSKLTNDAKLSPGNLPALQDAFMSSIQGMSAAQAFEMAKSKSDDLFGNHFTWSLKMAEMLLRLDDAGKARLEIALRRASPLRATNEYKERTMFLLEYDLDN